MIGDRPPQPPLRPSVSLGPGRPPATRVVRITSLATANRKDEGVEVGDATLAAVVVVWVAADGPGGADPGAQPASTPAPSAMSPRRGTR